METTLTDDCLSLAFESKDEVRGFFDEARKQAGFFAQLPRLLQFRDQLRIEATAPDFELSFAAEVVQVFPVAGAFGTGFQLIDWGETQQEDLEKRLQGKVDEAESGTSPSFRIRKMNPSERFRLSMRGNRTERAILMRDTSPQVLLGLLMHPQIEIKEVLEVVKSNFASGAIMERVAKNRQWLLHPEIPMIIVKSPKTPAPLALKLLDGLRKPDLQKLAKGAPRETLRRAALKLYEKRNRRS
jgi:hypothetical protein